MGLSDDQKALLRLLAQREEGYEDIAALLGLSVGEVRARVKGALAELDSAAGTAAKEAMPPPPPATPAKPPAPAASEPVAEQPAPARAATPRPTARPAKPARRLPSVPKDRRRLFELAGGLLVVALIALFATGVLNIGGDDDGDSSADATAAANGKITQAALTPPDGGDAIGRAIFGRVGKGPVLQVVAENLEPTANGESYTVWLYRSPKLVLRLGSVPVDESGGLGAQLPLPTELFAYLAGGAFDQISISRTNDAEYAAVVAQARKQKRLPPYSGTTVLRGEIVGPLVSQ